MKLIIAAVGAMAIASAAAGYAASAGREARCSDARTAATEAVVRAYAQMVFVDHRIREGLERYVAADIRQHNPNIADGREAALAFLEPRARTWRSEIVNVIAEGDLAAVHQHAFAGPNDRLGRALVDLYRVKEGKIVEHWDVSQPVPEHALSAMF